MNKKISRFLCSPFRFYVVFLTTPAVYLSSGLIDGQLEDLDSVKYGLLIVGFVIGFEPAVYYLSF